MDKGGVGLEEETDDGGKWAISTGAGDVSRSNLRDQARVSRFYSAIELKCNAESDDGEDVRLGMKTVSEDQLVPGWYNVPRQISRLSPPSSAHERGDHVSPGRSRQAPKVPDCRQPHLGKCVSSIRGF